MTIAEALALAEFYGGDQVFGDERDQMSEALAILAEHVRVLEGSVAP